MYPDKYFPYFFMKIYRTRPNYRAVRSGFSKFQEKKKDIVKYPLNPLVNPLVPNYRKHCSKTFILPTVTYFGKYITKLHLKFWEV